MECGAAEREKMGGFMSNTIEWLGHATILIRSKKRVMVDPWKLGEAQPADLVLITHNHYDHCSPEDIAKVRGPETVVVGPPSVVAELGEGVTGISPGEEIKAAGLSIAAIAAYNVGKPYHPRSAGGVGYVVAVEGERIYIAGDTDHTPEMDAVQADVALLPVGGTYTMTAREAAEAANAIKPKLAIPVHYGDIVGSVADAREFESLCDVSVKVLTRGSRTSISFRS